jgi:predicted nucleotidyltransferase
MASILLSEEQISFALQILSRHLAHTGASVYAFGSRVTGHPRPFSDLDLAIECPSDLPRSLLFALEEDFSESTFPFSVDLVDLRSCRPDFRRNVDGEKVLFTFFPCDRCTPSRKHS